MLTVSPITHDFGSVTVGSSGGGTTFTVSNIGQDVSGTISTTILGAGAGNFVISANTCTTLAAAATCTVTVTFGPASGGAKAANLSISASPGGAVMSTLDGAGVALGGLTITPGSNSYGNVVVGASSGPTTFTVRNTSGAASGTVAVQPAGANPADFGQTNTCDGVALAPNATCTITATFSPTVAGPRSASFSVSSSPGGTVAAAVTGNALAPAQLVLFPQSRDFGSIVAGAASNNVTFNVANIGGVATGLLTQSVTGPDGAQFPVISSSCDGATLNPQSNCVVIAQFTPSSVGAKSGLLSLSGAPGGTVSSNLSGTGILAGQIQISQAAAFGNIIVGQVSTAQTLTVTNNGGTATGTLSDGLTGPNASQFQLVAGANNCQGAVLAAGGQCTIGVLFAPTIGASDTASLTVTGTPGGSVSASLSGNGIPGANLVISPPSQGYGTVGLGSQSAFQAFTVTNLGGLTTGALTVSLGGMNPTQFDIANGCSAALAPLATCIIMVRFKPTVIGNEVATINASASPGGSVQAALFGQGAAAAQIAVLPSTLTFPITNLGDTAVVQTFSVTNFGASTTGAITLPITGTAKADYAVSSNCTTLAPLASCTATVTYAPLAIGTRNATITATAMPGGSAGVSVTGTARPRLEIISIFLVPPGSDGSFVPVTNPLDFGKVIIGNAGFAEITVRNNTVTGATLTETFSGFGTDYVDEGLGCGKGSTGFIAGSGGTCTGFVFFEPKSVGIKNSSATFSIGPGVLNQAIQTMTGTGIDALILSAETTTDFGNVATGTTAPTPLKFQLSNPFFAPTSGPITRHLTGTVFTFHFGGPVVGTECFDGQTLTGGESCEITVDFHPIINGVTTTTLSVTVPAGTPGGAPFVDLSGIGVDPTHLIYNPDPLAFGTVFDGSTKDITVVVTNPAGAQPTGSMSFFLNGVSECAPITFTHHSHPPGGPLDPCFTILTPIAGDCISSSTVLSAGETCNIRVHFDPLNHLGPVSASLDVTANPGNVTNPHHIAVTGLGKSTISVNPASFDFGTLFLGDFGDESFTVSNDSLTAQTVTSFLILGAQDGLSFTFNSCFLGATLAPNGQCTFTVRFAPIFTGDFTDANIQIETNNGNGFIDPLVLGQGCGSGCGG